MTTIRSYMLARPNGHRYNRDSIERALDVHYPPDAKDGGWSRTDRGGYLVPTGVGIVEIRTLREAALFVIALADKARRLRDIPPIEAPPVPNTAPASVFYIIEHPTRGVLVDFDAVAETTKWQWSKPRSDLGNMRFETKDAAIKVLNNLPRKAFRNFAYVVRSPERPGAGWFGVYPSYREV